MGDPLLILTLTLVAAVESNGGTNVAHQTIRNPASMHFNDTATGRYGMMKKTIKWLKQEDDELAARELARRLLAKGNCPVKIAVVLWERGPYHKITGKSWRYADRRLSRVLLERRNKINYTKGLRPRFFR